MAVAASAKTRTKSSAVQLTLQSTILSDFSKYVSKLHSQYIDIPHLPTATQAGDFYIEFPGTKIMSEMYKARVQLNLRDSGDIFLNCGNQGDTFMVSDGVLQCKWHLSIHHRRSIFYDKIYNSIKKNGWAKTWGNLNQKDRNDFQLGSIHIRAEYIDVSKKKTVYEDYKLRMDASDKSIKTSKPLTAKEDFFYEVTLIDDADKNNSNAIQLTRLANYCLNTFYKEAELLSGGMKIRTKKYRRKTKRKRNTRKRNTRKRNTRRKTYKR